jgi:hypothetical protein
MQSKLRDEAQITKREKRSFEPTKVKRWFIEYKELVISAYYDAHDDLGVVGEPYFEIYNITNQKEYTHNFDDTARFLAAEDIDKMAEFLENEFNIHDKDLKENPEYFI